MSIGRGVATTTWSLVGMLSASLALGDSECNKGFRDTTAAERETITRVLETAKKGLPAAPEGWVIVGDDQVSVMTNLCRDHEAGPWTYTFSREYSRVDDQEARNAIMREAAAGMTADLKAKQPRLDAIMARMTKLSQEVAAAAQKGDQTGIEALNKELEQVSAEYEKLLTEGDPAAKIAAAGAEAGRDMFMHVTVTINPRRAMPDQEAKSLPAPRGAQSAFRWSAIRDVVEEDHALVLIGPWTRAAEGGYQPGQRAGVGAAAAQAITVHLTADKSRLAPTLEAIDFGALAASLAR